jgi:hypothetical protein
MRTREQKEPPELLDTYHKARTNYAFFSALLIAWQNFGSAIFKAILPNVKIDIGNYPAIPIVLFILVLYYGIRTVIEWSQSACDRRKEKASIVDHTLAHFIGTIAAIIFFVDIFLNNCNIEGKLLDTPFEIIIPILFGISCLSFIYSYRKKLLIRKNLLKEYLKKDFYAPLIVIFLAMVLFLNTIDLLTCISIFTFSISSCFGLLFLYCLEI